MPDDECRILLAELRVKTRSRDEGSDVVRFQQSVYARDLRAYPADIVRTVLRTWPDQNSFWPDWHELTAMLEQLTRKRRALAEVLEKNTPTDVAH